MNRVQDLECTCFVTHTGKHKMEMRLVPVGVHKRIPENHLLQYCMLRRSPWHTNKGCFADSNAVIAPSLPTAFTRNNKGHY